MVKVGKFTLESLTTGMYSDPKVIYREYIQNATDSIDKAVSENLLSKAEEGIIKINIDVNKKLITIEDNGTGIKQEAAGRVLLSIGDSEKDYKTDRGFRGIGRLGGLSYCEKLTFITSYKGESYKSIIEWDCTNLRRLLQPGQFHEYDLENVIQKVTNVSTVSEDPDSHYFKVELFGVNNKELLDEGTIRSYISQNAPVPFDAQRFYFYTDSKTGIMKQLADIGKPLEEYNIYVNGDPDPIYKPYKSWFKLGDNKRDDIQRIEHIVEYKEDGSLLFWGWYAFTNFYGQVSEPEIRGFRFRKSNILIGDERTADKFFTESRFNRYFIGEIYVYDEDLIPNARRDDFEPNESYEFFCEKLEEHTKKRLSKIPRTHSDINSSIKKIEKSSTGLKEITEKLKEGVSSQEDKNKLLEKQKQYEIDLRKSTEKLNKAKKKVAEDPNLTQKIDENLKKTKELNKKTQTISKEIEKAEYKFLHDKNLSHVPREVKKTLIKVFEVIDKELDEATSNKLQEKIVLELKTNRKK